MFEFPTDFGRYRLTGIAGEGGMATVYRGVLPGPMGFEKRLVVKVIRPSLVEDEEFLRALVNEALLGCQLHHPNIVEVYEFNQHAGRYYLAMELVDGISLSYLVRRHRKVGHAVPTPVTLHMLGQILDGLDYAHNAREEDGSHMAVIHRDLKPSNIAITPGGMIKILDFGIARASLSRVGMETSGAIRGTPRYMSPEQIETPTDIAPASDIFSLGAVLYELVTVRNLFAPRPGQEPIDLVLHMPLDEQISEVEYRIPGLGDVFSKMIARNATQRYASAAAVNRDLKLLHDKYGDADAARQYLGGLVAEYKEEAAADELVPEYFEPGFATGFEPWVAAEKGEPDATAPMKRPDPSGGPTQLAPEQPTIPLPPRPEQLGGGAAQQLGPTTTGSQTSTAQKRAAAQPFYGDDSSSAITPATPTTVTVRETGAHWGVVAALAVPLALIALAGVAFLLVKMAGLGGANTPGLVDGARLIWVEDEAGEEVQTEAPTPEPPPPLVERVTPEPITPDPLVEQDPTPEAPTEEPATPEVAVAEPSTPAPPPPPSGFGELRVDAEPWATVVIGGRSYGETPIKAKLSVGRHVIKLQCMGSGSVDSHTVTIRKDEVTPYYRAFPDELCP